MKEIWFIRHGESMGNAGFATSDPATIPLTDLGHKQADALANYIKLEPDLLVTSPFTRTSQTATPTINRFHSVKQDVWNIQEFTYLSPVRCANTTMAERKGMVDEYWQLSDPNHTDGDGSESFSDLISRVQSMWQQLEKPEPDAKLLIFTHGLFMNALRWSAANSFAPLTDVSMKHFHDFHLSHPVQNCGILKCLLDLDKQIWLQPGIDDFVSRTTLAVGATNSD